MVMSKVAPCKGQVTTVPFYLPFGKRPSSVRTGIVDGEIAIAAIIESNSTPLRPCAPAPLRPSASTALAVPGGMSFASATLISCPIWLASSEARSLTRQGRCRSPTLAT